MAKNTVVVLTREVEDFKKKLSDLNLPDLEIIIPKDNENASAEVSKANILFGNPPLISKYINEAKNIVWVQSNFTGIDALNTPELRKDYTLTNVRDAFGEVMSEYVFSYILYFEKEIAQHLTDQGNSFWNQTRASALKDKTICILGTGSVGKEIARVAKAFKMHTLGFHQKGNEKLDNFDQVFENGGLKDCLSMADYVVSVLPKTPETDNIINSQTISCMKDSATLLNIGRGNAVNIPDLISAVNSKKIKRAVLDVFNVEPLPKDSPLWTTPNIFITPHIAANIVSDKVLETFAENYKKFISGEELISKIDFVKGY